MKKQFMLGDMKSYAWAGLRFRSLSLQYSACCRCCKRDIVLTYFITSLLYVLWSLVNSNVEIFVIIR